ncbi:MAG: ATP-binding protein [bacterium]|nr:ATP-binding protein [bacterium]
MAAVVETQLADFEARELPRLTTRSSALPGLPDKADVVVGMRRSGKTWFVYQQIREHLAEGIGRDRLLYLNFEDERLLPLDAEDLHLVPEAFYRRHPESRGKQCWFYFDEIQNVPDWETFIRRLLDTENAAVVLTGSSAKLLSREIATSLRGRSLTTELLPFSFEESLRHAGVEIPERWPPAAPERSLLESRFERYLEIGGFPEVQDVPTDLRLRILRDYIDVVLLRDVAERHGVENLPALRYLERRLLAGPGGRFSLHRLYNDLKSQGLRVGKNSLYSYLDYLEDAFLIFTITVASPSLRVRQTNPRKCYPVDPALASAISFRASRAIGPRLENAVYLELRRRGHDLAYLLTSGGLEVDFVAEHPTNGPRLVQVSADTSAPKTRQRELRALEQAMEETEIEHATLVTLREEGNVRLESGTVRIVPAWRWFLEPEAEEAG